jgi:mono/diheme cytochrome c family protein
VSTRFIILLIVCSPILLFSQSKTIKIKKETHSKIDLGKKLFKENCSQCHGETNQMLTGPGLVGVTTRLKMSWLISWVRSSTELILSGDKYAVEVYKKYGTGQPDFKQLSNEEIKSIFNYVGTFKK